MFALFDKHRLQGRVKITFIADLRRLHRRQSIQNRAGPDRHSRLTQGAGEIGDVLRQPPGAIAFKFRASETHFGDNWCAVVVVTLHVSLHFSAGLLAMLDLGFHRINQFGGAGALHFGNVILILQQHAQCVRHLLRV